MPKPPLSSEQTNVVREKQVSLHRPINDLLDILGPIAQYDAAGDTSRRNLGCAGAAAIVLGVVGLFAFWPAGVVLIAAGIVLLIVWNKKKAEDISDNLRKCAVPLLVALREDFGGDPIELKLDLRPPMSPAKQTSKEKVQKSYWKRGSSGKSKLKTKRKKHVEIEADLTLKAKNYGEKQTLHGAAKVKRDGVDPITPDVIIDVIADLYKQAQPAAAS
jgi:hypothetical protein